MRPRPRASTQSLLPSSVKSSATLMSMPGPSTRLLVYVGRLMGEGIAPRRACEIGITQAMTDDAVLQAAVREVANAVFDG